MARGQLQFESTDDTATPEDVVAEAAAAFGMCFEEPLNLDDEFWLWPENETVFWLWCAVQTQWRLCDGRRVGLDYNAVDFVMRVRGVPAESQREYFMLLQHMEQEFLSCQGK